MENNEIWNIKLYERIQKTFNKYFKSYGEFEEIILETYLKLIKNKDLENMKDGYIYISLKNKLNDIFSKNGKNGNLGLNDILEYEDLNVFGNKSEEELELEDKKLNTILGAGSLEDKIIIRKIYDYFKEFDKISITKICELENWNYNNVKRRICDFRKKKIGNLEKNITEQFQLKI